MTFVADDPTDVEETSRRLADLLATDVDDLADAALTQAMLAVADLQGLLEARAATIAARWDGRTVWAADGARSGAAWMAARSEWSAGQGRATIETGRALRHCPLVDRAYQSGRLGTAKVRLLLRARDGVEEWFEAHEELLVREARRLTVAQAARFLAAWHRRALASQADGRPEPPPDEANALHLSKTFEGRWRLDADLDAESGAILAGAIGSLVDSMFGSGEARAGDGVPPARRRAVALVELVRRGVRPSSEGGAPRPLVLSIVDVDTLARRPLDGPDDVVERRCEIAGAGPVPLETVERHLCEGDLVTITTRNGWEVLDVGRAVRLATPAQRRALRIRDGGCVFPGCDQPVDWCVAHHVRPFEVGGPTDLANLVTLCRFHHHLVHDGGFGLTRSRDGTVRVRRPDGVLLPVVRHGERVDEPDPPGPGAAPPPPRFRPHDEVRRRARERVAHLAAGP